MESAGKTPECVERNFGEILAARNAAIQNPDDVPGVGPPDLCWIQRTAKPLFNKKPKTQGYYHWVVGLSITSEASVAAYFARLTSKGKKVGYLQGMGVGRDIIIERAIYCSYDPFSEMDVWIEVAMPGSAVSRALDKQGYLNDVTEDVWKGVNVGCFLRSQIYDVSVTLHCSRAFQHMEFFEEQEDEIDLLSNVLGLYEMNQAQRSMPRLHWDRGQGTHPHHLDVLCTAVLEHFKKRRRWQKALQFFTKLQGSYPSSVVYQSEIYKELDDVVAAADLIKSALRGLNKKDHPMLVLAGGYIYLKEKEWNKAIHVAQTVIDQDSQIRPAWLLLSRAYLCKEDYHKSLRALDLMPEPPIPPNKRASVFRALPPAPKFVTKRSDIYDPELTEVCAMVEEIQRKGWMTKSLPAEILAPRVHEHGLDWGLTASTKTVLRAAYDILLDVVHLTGWRKFCETRAAVFLIPNEGDKGPSEASRSPRVMLSLRPTEDIDSPVLVVLEFKFDKEWSRPTPIASSSLYARSMSAGTPPTAGTGTGDEPPAGQTELTSKVLTRGLGQVTRKVLRRTSSSASTVLRYDNEQTLSPTSVQSVSDGFFEGHQSPSPRHPAPPVARRQQTEIHTSAKFSSDEEVPDAPENALPKICRSYSERPPDRPPSIASFSQDKWQVKIVSMGIKDRVKYFDQMAKEKIAKRESFLSSTQRFDGDFSFTSSTRPNRSRYTITQTIVDRLSRDYTTSEFTEFMGDEFGRDADETVSSHECTPSPEVADWGSFALNGASRIPHSRPSTRLSLFEGAVPDLVDNEGVQCVDDDAPRKCSEWLDELTLALWEDLAAYTEFKRLDRQLKAQDRPTHAEQILGTVEVHLDSSDEETSCRSPTAGQSVPDSRPVDWMRRGLLCERLRKVGDAEQAYRVSTFLSVDLTSLLALSRIYSEWGYCKGAVLVLNRLAQYHHKKRNSKKDSYIPSTFVKHISLLLLSVGNKDIKSATEDSHLLVRRAVDDAIKWKRFG